MDNLNWQEKLNQYKIPIGLSLVGIVLIAGGVFVSGLSKPKQPEFPKESIVESAKSISIDVSGAVVKAGVYKLVSNTRVEDAIKSAGGLREDANQEYISKHLNLAQKLSDGSKIYIPFEGEEGVVQTGTVAGSSSELININNASQSDLEALPGIGPVAASKIISDRPYSKIEELLDKKVITKTVFEKIKDQISVY